MKQVYYSCQGEKKESVQVNPSPCKRTGGVWPSVDTLKRPYCQFRNFYYWTPIHMQMSNACHDALPCNLPGSAGPSESRDTEQLCRGGTLQMLLAYKINVNKMHVCDMHVWKCLRKLRHDIVIKLLGASEGYHCQFIHL